MPVRRPVKTLSALAVSSMLAHTPALAETFLYGVDAGVGESDNISLVPNHKISQTVAVADFDFAFKETTRRFDVDAKGDFSYLDFVEGAYGSELIGRLDGVGRAVLIPEHLSWVLQDDFGQAQIDPFAAITPNNRENVNYVSTGPDLALRLGHTGFVDVTARYARTEYAVSPFDNSRYTASAAVGVPISAQSSASLNGTTERVLFSDTLVNTDFSRSSAYGHYETAGARTTIMANLGVTRVQESFKAMSGPLAKLELSRVLSSASKLTFDFGRDLTDATTSFANLNVGAISVNTNTVSAISAAPAAVTSTNYTVTYASANWQYIRNRTTLSLSGRWEKDAYDGLPALDLTRDTADARIERRLTQALSVQLHGSVYRTAYANLDSTERDALIGTALTWRKGRGLEVRLRYDHVNRAVSGIGTGYGENRAFLTVGYRPAKSPLG